MKRLAVVLVSMGAVVLGFGMVAEAQNVPYDDGGGGDSLSLSPPTASGGSSVTVEVGGCTSGEGVELSIDSVDAATLTCVDSSTATGVVEAPAAAGTYTVAAAGSQGFAASSALVVTAVAVPAAGALPATGSGGVNTTVALAAGLLAVGVALFVVAQLRRRRNVSLV